MENKFELNNISETAENDKRKYTLGFSDGKVQETITLVGSGKIKEPVKI